VTTIVKKKLEDESFAAKVDRAKVYAGPERLGTSLDEHIQLVIEALIPHAKALGIEGSSRPGGEKP
jgi:predicted hydrolase (HD superfamily)